MSNNAVELSDKRGVIHGKLWITPLLLGITEITLQNSSVKWDGGFLGIPRPILCLSTFSSSLSPSTV